MVVDTTYYDLLSLPPTATALDIKKAYRKAAIKLHPDKNPDDPDAHTRFQEVGQAYQVLSDEKLREKYDKYGIQESIPSEGFEDPAEFFSQIFGGEAFKDWIGELSLMSELSKSAELSGENDEKPAEKPTEKGPDPEATKTAEKTPEPKAFGLNNDQVGTADTQKQFGTAQTPVSGSSQKDTSASSANTKNTHVDEASVPEYGKKTPLLLDNGQTTAAEGTTALTAEEEEKRKRQEELERFEEECRLKKIEMRKELGRKLVEKLYLYTESDMADDVAESFRQKMKYEAESLKMESFGLEILHLVGSIYKTKAKILLKSQTFLGGLGGLWWSMKDKGGVVRDTFKTVASALDAQSTMQEYTKMQEDNEYHARKEAEAAAEAAAEKDKAQQDMDRLEEELQKAQIQQEQSKQQAKEREGQNTTEGVAEHGQAQSADSGKEKQEKVPEKHTPEDLQEMEKYLLGKVLAAAWSGSKFEISGTVRAVCDQILYDKEASLETRIARAKGLKIIGSVFSETSRTESEAEEARVFEELVAEASQKRRRRKPEASESEATEQPKA